MQIPVWAWVILCGVGIALRPHWTTAAYIVCSAMYIKKGILAPFFRGLQYFCFVPTPLVFTLITGRNIAGDLRDVTKDKREGTKTIPLVMGVNQDFKSAHILALFATTFVWWYIADISVLWLVLVYLIQLLPYNLTPR